MKRKLKNWFVRFETIKNGSVGVVNLSDYINDNQHNNHKKQGHEIISYDKDRNLILRNHLTIQQRADNVKLIRGTAGRKSSFGKSIVLSLPKEIKLSNEDWKIINDRYIYELVNFISKENNLNYSKEQIEKYSNNFIQSTLHKQQDNNDHIHFLVPNVFVDYNKKSNLKRVDLGKLKYSHFSKNIINKIMLDNFNIDYLKHIIKDTRKNRNRKNKIHHTQDKLNQQLNQSTKDIEKLQDLFQELDSITSVSKKLSKNINIYINRMKTATEELNQEKFDKNLTYANKSYNKLKNLVEEENISKLSKFEELKKSIESKKSKSTNYPSPARSR
jgi:hypothetical protein